MQEHHRFQLYNFFLLLIRVAYTAYVTVYAYSYHAGIGSEMAYFGRAVDWNATAFHSGEQKQMQEESEMGSNHGMYRARKGKIQKQPSGSEMVPAYLR